MLVGDLGNYSPKRATFLSCDLFVPFPKICINTINNINLIKTFYYLSLRLEICKKAKSRNKVLFPGQSSKNTLITMSSIESSLHSTHLTLLHFRPHRLSLAVSSVVGEQDL